MSEETVRSEWQARCRDDAKYFAAAIVGLIGLFAIAHWVSSTLHHLRRKPVALSSAIKLIQSLLRRTKHVFVFGGTSIVPAQIWLAVLYFAVIAILTFHDSPQSIGLTTLAQRLGWMTLCNLCLTIFLGLKNTPLSPIAGYSYDSVNILHRCVGRTTVVLVILHGSIYAVGLSEQGIAKELFAKVAPKFGPVAGLSMIVILLSTFAFVRRRQYELFYVAHIVLVSLILIAVGLHQPDLSEKALIITIVAACMWIADQSLRVSRWIYYGFSNHCTLVPLPGDATRVVMHRSVRAQPGSHVFLWIPGVRAFERHPFTLVSNEPVEFVIKARNGFTRDLYLTSCKTPNATYKASIEGPYGNTPSLIGTDKVVLIAGGSGITFVLAIAREWVRRKAVNEARGKLDFVWCVKGAECLDWFGDEISELQARPDVSVSLHISTSSKSSAPCTRIDSVARSQPTALRDLNEKQIGDFDLDRRKSWQSQELYSGRPNVDVIIAQASASLPSSARILVAACGPASLLASVRKTVTRCTVVKAPEITMHLEEFSI